MESKQDQVDVFMKLARKLSHVEKSERDAAFSIVKTFLIKRPGISHTDLMKVWKGLFYCMFLSDKWAIQCELADQMGEVIHLLKQRSALNYIGCCYETMSREWGLLDHLRLDKYFYLLRSVMKNAFLFLARNNWDEELVSGYVEVVSMHGLSASHTACRGVVTYVIEHWLEDLVAAECTNKQVATKLMEPMVSLLSMSTEEVLLKLVQEEVFNRLQPADRVTEEDGANYPDLVDRKALAKRCFLLGAHESTEPKYRKLLYKVHRILLGPNEEIDLNDEDIELTTTPSPAAAEKPAPMKRRRVVVVEDEPPVARPSSSSSRAERSKVNAKSLKEKARSIALRNSSAAPAALSRTPSNEPVLNDADLQVPERPERIPSDVNVPPAPEFVQAEKKKNNVKGKVKFSFDQSEVLHFDKNHPPANVQIAGKRRKMSGVIARHT